MFFFEFKTACQELAKLLTSHGVKAIKFLNASFPELAPQMATIVKNGKVRSSQVEKQFTESDGTRDLEKVEEVLAELELQFDSKKVPVWSNFFLLYRHFQSLFY